MDRKEINLGSTSVQNVQIIQTLTTSPDGTNLQVLTLKTDRSVPVVQTESVSTDRSVPVIQTESVSTDKGVSSDRSVCSNITSLLYQMENVSQVTTF